MGIPERVCGIEQVKPEEHVDVVAVWEASVRATHHFLAEADIQFLKPRLLQQYLSLALLFCVRHPWGQIAGLLGVAVRKVEMLFVDPLAQGQGVGTQLLTFARTHLQATQVDVNEQNQQALRFYQRAGFQVKGRSEFDGLGKHFPILHLQLASEAE